MTIDEARDHIGHEVVYRSARGEEERGVITFVGGRYVFVRYGTEDGRSLATRPEDLELLAAPDVTERRRQFRASLRGDVGKVPRDALRREARAWLACPLA